MEILPLIITIAYNFITIYINLLFIYAIMSWFPAISQSSIGQFIYRLVDPYLSIFDRLPTRVGLFDFKVLIGMMGLFAIQRFILILF